MTTAQNIVRTETFTHNGKPHEIVVFQDAERPTELFVEVLSNGRRVPIPMPVGVPALVRYSVTFETERDARMTMNISPVEELIREARRQVEASL